MTPLEMLCLALQRAIYNKDNRRHESLEVLYNELQSLHLERNWQFSPHASDLYGRSPAMQDLDIERRRQRFAKALTCLSEAFYDAAVAPGLATIIVPRAQFERLAVAMGVYTAFLGEQKEQPEFHYMGFRFLVEWDPGTP